MRNKDVQVERPSNELVPNENVQAGQNSTDHVQVRDEHIQDAPPGQSPNQPVQAEEVSTKEVHDEHVQAEVVSPKEMHDENVQAMYAPFEPLQVQEAPAEQNSNLNTRSEGGPTNPIQVDDVPGEIVDVDQSRESESEGTESILGEVRACIEERNTAKKLKSRDWYDGIDPRTMKTDDERHLQFGLPSSKKRTATNAFTSYATDGSVAPRATKAAKTSRKRSTKQPKPVLDEAGKAEVARRRKEQQKAYRKKHAEKKKAEKLAQQHERASSISTMSSQSQSNEESNNVSSEDDNENEDENENNNNESLDDSDAVLATELDKAIKDMAAADQIPPTHEPTATTAERYVDSESEESEEE